VRHTEAEEVRVKVLGVCGSLQRESKNLGLLHCAVQIAPSGMRITLFDGIRDLPLFDPDLEQESGTPPAVRAWRNALRDSDAVLIASPEYGHSLPGALKNAIDWVFGSGELYGKRVAVTAAAPEPRRGERGLAALCTTLRAAGAKIIGGEPIVRGPDFNEELSALLEALL
jgi:chromate reductase